MIKLETKVNLLSIMKSAFKRRVKELNDVVAFHELDTVDSVFTKQNDKKLN